MQIIELLIKKYGHRGLAEQWRRKGQSLETTYCMMFDHHEPVGRAIARAREDQAALFAKAHEAVTKDQERLYTEALIATGGTPTLFSELFG